MTSVVLFKDIGPVEKARVHPLPSCSNDNFALYEHDGNTASRNWAALTILLSVIASSIGALALPILLA
ncbi:hypothetical protein [Agrobacterium sp.]|uniref:hypothetical protein n=1 Tax=Agrobacterium sp. TaxID=361 RepID=UPI0028A814E4|nr:hypothetical protein [Agrobacterium sp.]